MKTLRNAALVALLSLVVACGASNDGSPSQTGTVNLMLSDSSTEDWSLIGVKVLGIALVPQGGGAPVTVFTALAPAPVVNLVQLDQLGEILGNVPVPPGTYTRALVTIAANPGDVQLTAASDPESGFAGTPGASIPANHIRIQGATGTPGSLTTAVNVKLEEPLVVTANGSNALDLEFDLGHPAFIVDHTTPAGTFWAVSFTGPLHHHPLRHLSLVVLRQMYGTVTATAADGTAFTITKDYPVHPATNPETAIASKQSLSILADAANGTIFYDVDAKTHTVIKDFSSVAATLDGKYVRVAARYQDDGTLVAVRVWASASFQKVWLSPEGHVLHVNTTSNVLTVENEDAAPVPLTVDANTQFFFRTPAKGLADTTPIGTGTGFLANLKRGFKVHVAVVDPLANPLVAQTVDIEIAKFDGAISAPSTSGFTYTRSFVTPADDYTVTLPYISSATPNGTDASGAAIQGFKWWNLTFPTLAESGASAIPDFVSATGGAASFGGTARPMRVWGESYALWNDPASPNGWAADFTVLVPQPAPLGVVATPWAPSANGGSFGLAVTGGTNTVTVDLSSVVGSATLVYQVDRTNDVVTVSPEDLTTADGLAAVAAHLVASAPVKVFGVPQADGSIKAYIVFYFTGSTPMI